MFFFCVNWIGLKISRKLFFIPLGDNGAPVWIEEQRLPGQLVTL